MELFDLDIQILILTMRVENVRSRHIRLFKLEFLRSQERSASWKAQLWLTAYLPSMVVTLPFVVSIIDTTMSDHCGNFAPTSSSTFLLNEPAIFWVYLQRSGLGVNTFWKLKASQCIKLFVNPVNELSMCCS